MTVRNDVKLNVSGTSVRAVFSYLSALRFYYPRGMKLAGIVWPSKIGDAPAYFWTRLEENRVSPDMCLA